MHGFRMTTSKGEDLMIHAGSGPLPRHCRLSMALQRDQRLDLEQFGMPPRSDAGEELESKTVKDHPAVECLSPCADLHPLWGYIHTSQNPADRPSRRPVRRKWAK